MTRPARVLVIAGSDSGGGAGIQADIKTISALGAYAATAITAVTVQNTMGVTGIHPVPPAVVADQIRVVLDDIGADCLKLGMLGDADTIDAVADVLTTHGTDIPLVLDPVMVAKGGSRLLTEGAIDRLASRLVPMATIVTPNIPEAEVLTGRRIAAADAMPDAAAAMARMGAAAVYLKGGHLAGDLLVDMLAGRFMGHDVAERFESARIDTPHTHGTGCTLASAIAAGLADGMGLAAACRRAHAFVRAAILQAPGLGRGHGPLNHLLTVRPFAP